LGGLGGRVGGVGDSPEAPDPVRHFIIVVSQVKKTPEASATSAPKEMSPMSPMTQENNTSKLANSHIRFTFEGKPKLITEWLSKTLEKLTRRICEPCEKRNFAYFTDFAE